VVAYVYFAPDMVRSVAVGVPVCLSVHAHDLKYYTSKPRNFPCVLSVVVAELYSDDSALRYLLPVLWMA